MGLFDQVKDRASKVVAAGSAQVIDLRDNRRRKSLFCELGELTYRARQGETISDSDIDRVVDQVTALDADVESDEDESAKQADEAPSDEGPSDEG